MTIAVQIVMKRCQSTNVLPISKPLLPKKKSIDLDSDVGSQIVTARPIRANISPTVTTSCTTSDEPVSRRMSTRSMPAPNKGAMTKMQRISESGAGTPQSTRNCQYTNAMNMPMAPWAKLKMPDVVYVTTMPEAAIA